MSWFRKRKPEESGEADSKSADLKHKAMVEALQAAQEKDPYIVNKVTAKDLNANLLEILKDGRGVHIETALAALGSLAGFACIVQAWFEQKANADPGRPQGLHVVSTDDGQRFFFGDLINAALLESPTSIWGLTGGMAKHLGAQSLPDVTDIVAHVAKSVGSESFGVPRIAEGHSPMDTPINLVSRLWPMLAPVMTRYTSNARDLPITLGFSIQQLMEQGRSALDPSVAALIVMECAVPMAHVDPDTVASG